MRRRIGPAVFVVALVALCGFVGIAGTKQDKQPREMIAERLSNAPHYPEFEIPAEWGDLVAMTSMGGGIGSGRDENRLAFRSEDGTIRLVHMTGGLPTLTHLIRRTTRDSESAPK